MKKLLARHHKTLEVLIHVISWIIFFTFPLLMTDRTNEDFNWTKYLHHTMVPITFIIVFYINYFFLIPRYLFRERTYTYILYNLLLIIITSSFLHLWHTTMAPSFKVINNPGPRFPGWFFFVRDIVSLGFAIGLSAIIRISRRWTKIEAARREAEKSRTEAELKNLRNQLNPHFLLNTLNNIYALISFDTDKAQQAVQELSKLLRYMLYDNQQNYVPLSKEADFIRNYIELMRIRLSSNVTLKTEIGINKNSRTLVAPLLFISLIENAFKHGISPTEPSYIHISLFEEGEKVTCEIINSNFPKSYQDKSGSGIGLPQVSKRLELLYPNQYTWEKYVSEEGKKYISRLQIKTTDT
ncbi:sensor histidine kinase [Bacteroides sp. 224]|uniref:sensor histidine kinase n=1 Tax=Bacteroides sp. 224 TaxID=2302936 RepID=UPI0013D76300|nr:histidine kinase [Bacteroides sp. 224]NDV66733.1 sensor histidine kinase [Bacteroides sp. 224]